VPTAVQRKDFLRAIDRCAGTAVDGSVPDAAVQAMPVASWTKGCAARFVRAPVPARFAFSLRFACVVDAAQPATTAGHQSSGEEGGKCVAA